MSIDAMKQALEALVREAEGWYHVTPITRDAIIALRAAIEQEPVSLNKGRLTRYADGSIGVGTPTQPEQAEGGHLGIGDGTLMLDGQYPHSKEWQGLTRQEFLDATKGLEDLEDCWMAIEAALRSKNNGLS